MKRQNGQRDRWRSLACGVGCVVAAVAVLLRPEAAAGGVRRGLSLCGTVILPSLFPFLVLCGFAVHSGAVEVLGKPLSRPVRRWLGLPPSAVAAVVLGLVGGYPAGAVATGELVRTGRLTREEGRRLLRFAVNAGPGFAVGTVGAGLLGRPAVGWMLWGAEVAAALLIAGCGVPTAARQTDSVAARPTPLSPAAALTRAVDGACSAAATMAGFTVLFSVVTALCDGWGLVRTRTAAAALSVVLEVGGGCTAAASLPAAPLWLGFALGWGGLSVACQVAAAVSGTGTVDASFFLFRLLHGLLTAGLTALLLRLVPQATAALAVGSAPVAVSAVSVPVSAALLLLCGVWMLAVSPQIGDGTAQSELPHP